MGIGRPFKRRRERESALPPGALEEMGSDADGSPGADQGDTAAGASEPEAAPTELPGADAGELGEMLRRAAATGLPQVSTESHQVDAASGELAKEILGILGRSGLGGAGGVREVDAEELREMHDRVNETLRQTGVPPDAPARGDARPGHERGEGD